jgi:hypothetical protein
VIWMSKADRIVSYFPSLYRATQRTKLLYDIVARLAAPLEEADTLLFRIQRAHRLQVTEHPEDIMRLAAALNLTPFHFEDLLADRTLTYEAKLARIRARVSRVSRVHLIGLGTPWAVLEAAAIFLDATLVPERPGAPLIRHLDDAAFSHVARLEFSLLPDRPRAHLYLHENPLVRRKEEPTARWPLRAWTITNHNVVPSSSILSIQGIEDRTVLPSIFCPDTGEGILFNGVIPAGKTLVIDAEHGAQLDGTLVNAWALFYQGGLYDFASVDSAMAVVEEGIQGAPFADDVPGIAMPYQPKQPVPRVPIGPSQWYFNVAQGVYDSSLYDYAVCTVPPDPIGIYDGDVTFDTCRFDYPPSATAGMAWDERLLCAFKLLLPAVIPQPGQASAPTIPAPGVNAASPSANTHSEPGQGVNYVGRIGSILPRFKAAGIRAYVDTARDAWIVGEGVLRSTTATAGEGITVHTTRLRDPRSEMFVDAETTS